MITQRELILTLPVFQIALQCFWQGIQSQIPLIKTLIVCRFFSLFLTRSLSLLISHFSTSIHAQLFIFSVLFQVEISEIFETKVERSSSLMSTSCCNRKSPYLDEICLHCFYYFFSFFISKKKITGSSSPSLVLHPSFAGLY